jgi:cytochrome c oxidase cbb3-type subunit 2
MTNPRDVVPESIMPGYPWLGKTSLDGSDIRAKMETLRTLGAPYSDTEIESAPQTLEGKTELDALIAYLQGLGIELKTRK